MSVKDENQVKVDGTKGNRKDFEPLGTRAVKI